MLGAEGEQLGATRSRCTSNRIPGRRINPQRFSQGAGRVGIQRHDVLTIGAIKQLLVLFEKHCRGTYVINLVYIQHG